LGDDAVVDAAHRDALPPQEAEQGSGSNVAVHGQLNRRQRFEKSAGPMKTGVGPEPLQHLRDDDRQYRQFLFV
jgi:hypothetical protein